MHLRRYPEMHPFCIEREEKNMFLGRVNYSPSVINTNIPITVDFNTNNKIGFRPTTNEITFRKTGLYNVDGALFITGATGDVGIILIADGKERRVFGATLANAGDVATIPIVDAIRVTAEDYPQIATLAIQTDIAGLDISGDIRVEYVQ